MANLTIRVDDRLLRKARVRAAELGTSVSAVLREYLSAWIGGVDSQQRAVARLLERSELATSVRGGRRWTRDDLHERH